MRSTILGLGEWRGEHVKVNADWPAEVVATWRERAALERAARAKAAAEGESIDAVLSALPDLDAADRLSIEGFTRDAEDVFLFAEQRHFADAATSAIQAGARAGAAALADAGVDAREIDVVIQWDAVPDRPGVPAAPKVCELIGASRAHGVDVQQACASAISSIELAAALVESGRARYVLLTQTHLAMRMFGMTTPVSVNTGDCATAIVVGPSERTGIVATHAVSDGSFADAVTVARGKDDASDTPWWTPGGAFMLGTKDKPRAMQMMRDTVKMGALTIREACERARTSPADLDVIAAPHPRRWIPGAIARTLGKSEETAPHLYETIAHVGGCGAVANLIEARRRGMLREGAKVAMYAQGQGMTRAAAILCWGAR